MIGNKDIVVMKIGYRPYGKNNAASELYPDTSERLNSYLRNGRLTGTYGGTGNRVCMHSKPLSCTVSLRYVPLVNVTVVSAAQCVFAIPYSSP